MKKRFDLDKEPKDGGMLYTKNQREVLEASIGFLSKCKEKGIDTELVIELLINVFNSGAATASEIITKFGEDDLKKCVRSAALAALLAHVCA